ncbi:MAG: glutaminyl-peptide cyclotransferase [Nitrospirae bacterium]|nr:glutaminyl-peptide cyclotransferase [Nitrospirota bacterium]
MFQPFLFLLLFTLTLLSFIASSKSSSTPVFTYTIINTYPHDFHAFTQGLVFNDGLMYEGTGLKGQSTLRSIKLETGKILKVRKLSEEFFGEGITVYGNKIIQLTWQSHIGFIYDKDSFKLLKTFQYSTEGWGITHDGKQLIMSDGSANLYFLNPETLKETRRIEVRDQNNLVIRLNELEYINGEIFANVWMTSRIAKIDPQTGRVTGWINLDGLSPFNGRDERTRVLNGIAYDAKNDRLFVTGKLWPKLFEIKLVPAE